jgi:AraC family transcriptional regulator, positive regulator of tynA and feaB
MAHSAAFRADRARPRSVRSTDRRRRWSEASIVGLGVALVSAQEGEPMSATVAWSTRDVDDAHQFDYWREVVCSAFVQLSPERPGKPTNCGFVGAIHSRSLGSTGVSRIVSHAQVVHRRPQDIAATPVPITYLNMQISGSSSVTQRGNTAELRPGDITLLDADEPFDMTFDGPFQQWSLHLNTERLRARCGDLHDLCARPLDLSPGLTGLLGDTVRAVWKRRDELGADEAVHAGDHLEQQVCSIITANHGRPSHHAVLRQRALALIERNIADHRLSPATLAANLGVSVRLLHQVFSGHTATVHESIVEARLRVVADRLHAAPFALRSIAQIAADCGVGDLSHFTRTFRARYGASPREYRNLHG